MHNAQPSQLAQPCKHWQGTAPHQELEHDVIIFYQTFCAVVGVHNGTAIKLTLNHSSPKHG